MSLMVRGKSASVESAMVLNKYKRVWEGTYDGRSLNTIDLTVISASNNSDSSWSDLYAAI